jgi:hypothetical protein
MPGLCASDVPIEVLSNARNPNFLEIHREQFVSDLQPKSQVDGFPHESVDIVVDIAQKDVSVDSRARAVKAGEAEGPHVATVP